MAFNWEKSAVKFFLGECPLQGRPVYIESREQMNGDKMWIVKMQEWVLGADLYWYYEPIPSMRTKKFIENTRFETKEIASAAYNCFLGEMNVHTLNYDKSKIQ